VSPGGDEEEPMMVTDEGDGTGSPPGEDIVRAALIGTALFVVVAVAAAVSRPLFSTVAVVVSLGLFAAGCVAFLWAYAVAVQRSRVDAIGMGGLFFLHGSAPRRVQRLLIGAVVVQVVVALATAAFHPFTSQAFVILVPMYGLGLSGLWGAKHGTFAPREDRAAR
jgi:hypothetical protein